MAAAGFFFSCATFRVFFIVAPTKVISPNPESTMNRTAGIPMFIVAMAATWGPPATSRIFSFSAMMSTRGR